MEDFDNHISTDLILWVDFIASGRSINNFSYILPHRIKEKSFYFLYHELPYVHIANIPSDKVYLYHVGDNFYFQHLIAEIIGHAERYELRCLKIKQMDNKFDIELFDYNQLPIKNSSLSVTYCVPFANYLYDQIQIVIFKKKV